ncbi:fatty acid desaturase [Patulibacter minatonensis]|uniref:fatty acid desaturase n=1 Tax=Patulibacter minatonensis TaxID=298163 RepID=UPI0004B348D8|nr:fatty acid desaturase [Patulibacter minatonensis]
MSTTIAPPDPAPAPAPGRNSWKSDLAPYARPDVRKSVLDLLTSVVPYIAGFVAMYLLLDVSYLLTLLLAIPTAGFLLRTYIVFHDCAHGNFLPTKRANHVVGVFTSLLVYTPFAAWRHSHAMHHASAGDLDRRGDGDVWTMTVAEWETASRGKRLEYRLSRSPWIMMTLGPFVALVIQPRRWKSTDRPRIQNSVKITNVALLVGVTALCVLMGPLAFFAVQVPLVVLAGGAGIWLFFVQHQYEDAYWENTDSWDYAEAALKGSSYLKLPKVLQYFSGNIGLHHVHHLSSKVPNYHLQAAHDNTTLFREVPVLTLGTALKAMRLKLWCEDRKRLVTWREAAAGATA